MPKKHKTINTSKNKVIKPKGKKVKNIVVLSTKKILSTKNKKVTKKIVPKIKKVIISKKKVPKQILSKVKLIPKKVSVQTVPLVKKKILTPKKVKTKLRKKFRRVEAICILTGVTKRFSYKRAKLIAAKLNFISVDIFKESFLSRDACTLLKQGFSEVEIKQKYNYTTDKVLSFDIIKRYIKAFNYKEKMMRKRKRKIVNDLIDLQNSDNKIVAEYKPVPINFKDAEQVAYLTKDVCIRPDIHLNGDHSCNFCPHFELCICKRKYWNKKISKTDDKPNKKPKRL